MAGLERSHSWTSTTALLSAARGGSLFGLIVAMALLSRALPPAEYGTFRQCWVAYMLVVPIASSGLLQSLFYFIPLTSQDGQGNWILVRRSLAAALCLGMSLAAVAIASAGLLREVIGNPHIGGVIVAFAVFVGASVPMQLSDGIFMSVGRPRLAAIFNVLNRNTLLIGLALPVSVLGWSLVPSLGLLGAVQVLALVALWWIARKAHASPSVAALAPSEVTPATQWSFALPFVGASLFGALLNQMDKMAVGAMATPAEFAVYSNGAIENPIVSLVVPAAWASVASQLVRLRAAGDTREFARVWADTTSKVALVLFPVGAFVYVFASEVVVMLYSERYVESASVLKVYVLLSPVRAMAYSTLLGSINRNRAYLVGHAIAGLLLAGAAPAAYWAAGAMGAAAAYAIVSFAVGTWFMWVVARDLGVPLIEAVPLARLFRVLVASVIAAGVARTTVHLAGFRGAASIVFGGMAMAVCGALLFVVMGVNRPPVGSRPGKAQERH